MKKQIKRLACLLTAALMLCFALPAGVSAASKPKTYSKMSSSYKAGPYYKKLMEIELTGDPITDLLAVAWSQVGYHEGSKKNDLSGESTGRKAYTEYGNFTGTNGHSWCASFVSWCFRAAKIPTSVMPTSAGVGGLRNSVKNCKAVWHSVDSGYTPKAGDLVLYEHMENNYSYYSYASRDKNGLPTTSSHVGIVVEDYDSAAKSYCVIDGSGTGDQVSFLNDERLYMPGPTKDGGVMNRIQGFVTPNYGKKAGTAKLDVSITTATDAAVTKKLTVSDNNAVIAAKITKPSALPAARSGFLLSAADGRLIKDYSENTITLSSGESSFHLCYSLRELMIRLTPATRYRYQFYTVIAGKTYYGSVRYFTTTGQSGSSSTPAAPAEPAAPSVPSIPADPPAPSKPTAPPAVSDNTAVTFGQEEILTDKGEIIMTPGYHHLTNSLTKPASAKVTAAKFTVYSPDGSKFASYPAKVDSGSPAILSHALTDSEFAKFSPGVIYEYEVSASVNGKKYLSERWPLRLEGVSSEPLPSNPSYTFAFYDVESVQIYGLVKMSNGQNFKLLKPPVKRGREFLGWYLDDQLITEDMIVDVDPADCSFIITAKWR